MSKIVAKENFSTAQLDAKPPSPTVDSADLQLIQSVGTPDATLGTPRLSASIGTPEDGSGIGSVRAQIMTPSEPPRLPLMRAAADGAAADAAPRTDLSPPRDWTAKIERYADGKTSITRPGPNEQRMTSMRDQFEAASADGDADVRSVQIARMASENLRAAPLPASDLIPRPSILSPKDFLNWDRGAQSLSPRAAELRQGAMVAQTLRAGLEANVKAGGDGKDVLRAVMLLAPTERDTLLQADRLNGNGLINALHTHLPRSIGDPKSAEGKETQALYRLLRADVGMADVGLTLDRTDPTGTASGLLRDFRDTLEGFGVSQDTQCAFGEHLAFQAQIGDFAPTAPLDAKAARIFTADLMIRFAALEELPKTSRQGRTTDVKAPPPQVGLADCLARLPAADLKAVAAQALLRPTEGGQHVLRSLHASLAQTPGALGSESKTFAELLNKVERRAFDPKIFAEGIAARDALSDIETKLKADFTSRTAAIGVRLETKANETLKLVEDELAKLPSDDHPNATDLSKAMRAQLSSFVLNLEKLGHDQDGFKIDKAHIEALAERFGCDVCDSIKFPKLDSSTSSLFRFSLLANVDSINQLSTQIDSIKNPLMLKEGFKEFIPVLPTAGKSLESFHFVNSSITEMVAVADAIRTKDPQFSLANNPVIILDQSDGDGLDPGKIGRWNENERYLGQLQQQYGQSHGLNIVHVSMKQITALMKDSGIEKMFDTTRQGNPGYGGARNIAFLLGPVIADAVRNGQSVSDIKATDLVKMVKEKALGSDAPNLFMGDDTDYIRPGGMFAKVGLNATYSGEYYSAVSQRDGRSTMNVASNYVQIEESVLKEGPGAVIAFAFGNSRFEDKLRTPGMGCVTGGPRFCFDIPTGAEEKQHDATTTYTDQFARVSHLSGDRMKSYDRQVADFLNYAVGTEMFMALGVTGAATRWKTEATNAAKAWEVAFANNGEVLQRAGDAKGALQDQESFLVRLGGWLNKAEHVDGPLGVKQKHIDNVAQLLDADPAMDAETRAQFGRVSDTYKQTIEQAAEIKAFGIAFLTPIAPGFEKMNAEDLRTAVAASLKKDPKLAEAAFKKAYDAITANGTTPLPGNRQMLRDFTLIVESFGANGFRDLAAKLAA